MKFGLVNFTVENNNKCCEYIRSLNDKGFFISNLYTFISGTDFFDSVSIIKNNDIIFVMGDKDAFLTAVKNRTNYNEKNIFEIDSHLFLFLDKQKDLDTAEDQIRAYYKKYKISLSYFRILTNNAEDIEALKKLGDNKKKNIDNYVLTYNIQDNIFDLFIRYKNDSNITAVNSFILDKFYKNLFTMKFKSLQELASGIICERRLRISLAESFTGGAIARELVLLPGASNYLNESIVSYSNESKIDRLCVSRDTLTDFSAVSKEAALEMIKHFGKKSDIALASTGYAGPDADKPGSVGNCYFGLKIGSKFEVHNLKLTGTRQEIINKGVKTALHLLYQALNNHRF